MALGSSFSPPSLGLTWRVAAPTEGLASRVAVLDPDTLAFSDRTSVVPGRAMPFGLEFDHVHDVARGGATELEDLRRAAIATG